MLRIFYNKDSFDIYSFESFDYKKIFDLNFLIDSVSNVYIINVLIHFILRLIFLSLLDYIIYGHVYCKLAEPPALPVPLKK